MDKEIKGRARGGVARSEKLTPERRKEISAKAVLAKSEIAKLPKATHGSADKPLKIGDIEIPCYVLEDGTRVLSQRGLISGIGMSHGSTKSGDARPVAFFESDAIKPYEVNGLTVVLRSPIQFRPQHGGKAAYGYPATILADICETVLSARQAGKLPPRQSNIADQCEVLVRGFARVGIIALVDEATGYQKDRAKDDLATILAAFVAKELQPYLKTFPSDYYEHLFRLYELPYPPVGNKSWRPGFFGHITNEVVYSRLAPDLLPELKKAASKAEKKTKLHRWLTKEIGHPKLREHLSSIVSILKLSKTPKDFIQNVNIVHPRYGETKQMDFDSKNE